MLRLPFGIQVQQRGESTSVLCIARPELEKACTSVERGVGQHQRDKDRVESSRNLRVIMEGKAASTTNIALYFDRSVTMIHLQLWKVLLEFLF